jgi:protein-L-isoaspartate O-methyltransferase
MKTLDTAVLDRLFAPFGQMLTVEVARKLADYRFDAKAQARIDHLASKCNDGKLTVDENREYETYVQTIDFIAILQAKARIVLKQKPGCVNPSPRS